MECLHLKRSQDQQRLYIDPSLESKTFWKTYCLLLHLLPKVDPSGFPYELLEPITTLAEAHGWVVHLED